MFRLEAADQAGLVMERDHTLVMDMRPPVTKIDTPASSQPKPSEVRTCLTLQACEKVESRHSSLGMWQSMAMPQCFCLCSQLWVRQGLSSLLVNLSCELLTCLFVCDTCLLSYDAIVDDISCL